MPRKTHDHRVSPEAKAAIRLCERIVSLLDGSESPCTCFHAPEQHGPDGCKACRDQSRYVLPQDDPAQCLWNGDRRDSEALEIALGKLEEWQAHDKEVRRAIRRLNPDDKARDVVGSLEALAAQRDEARAAVIRIERELHARLAHPDYEYETTYAGRKRGPPPPLGVGWEVNVDYRGGFERFDYDEEHYWRRYKPEGTD